MTFPDPDSVSSDNERSVSQPASSNAFFFSILTNFSLAALAVVTGALTARLLGPTGRGELTIATIWPSVLLSLGGLGIPHTVAYFIAENKYRRRDVVTTFVRIGFVQSGLLIVVGLLVIPLALHARHEDIIPLGLVYLGAIPLSLFGGIFIGVLQGLLRMRSYALVRIIPTLGYVSMLFVLLLLARTGRAPKVAWVLAFLMGSLLVGLVLGRFFVQRALKPPSDGRILRSAIRPILRFGFNTQLANSTRTLNVSLDQLVMSIVLPAALLGVYAAAVSFSSAMIPLASAIGTVVLSDVTARQATAKIDRIAQVHRRTTLVILPATLLLMLITPRLLPWLFGESFAEGVASAEVLLVASLFLGLGHLLSEGLRGMNMPGVPAIAELAGLLTIGVLLFFLLPTYEILGAAVASLVGYFISYVVLVVFLKRHLTNQNGLLPVWEDVRAVLRMFTRRGRFRRPGT